MKSHTRLLSVFSLAIALATLMTVVAACGNSETTISTIAALTTTTATTDTPTGPAPVSVAATVVDASQTATAAAVEVTGRSGARTFTVAQLQDMNSVDGYGGFTCPPHPGVTGPTEYKGVALADLLESVGGLPADSVVSVAASDDYVMTFSTDQILNGGFTTYDPKTGVENTVEDIPQFVIAYESQGKPLTSKEGPFRLVFLTPAADQVVEGFLWVKWVTRIRVRGMNDDWTLRLAGATQKTLDHASFEALAADAGNSVAWEDIQGRIWTGVPLYVLAGLVDDEVESQADGFNQQLAAQGYKIEIVGMDGVAVTLDSAKIALNKDVIVANRMENNPLGDIEFPLRLVGDVVQSPQMVDGIWEIRVLVP